MPMPTSAPTSPPTAPPTPRPASAPMIGPAAINGPTPGIASAPMPASNPNVPPIVPPAATPVVTPSGAFVCFSCAKSFDPCLSAIRTDTSALSKRAVTSSSTARSARSTLGYSPNTAVFLFVMDSPWLLCRALGRGDAQLIDDASNARHFCGLGLDGLFLVLAPHGSLEGDLTVLGDDFHVVRIGGQRLVVHERAADFLGDLPLAGVLFLLVGGHRPFGAIVLVDFRVVSRRLRSS